MQTETNRTYKNTWDREEKYNYKKELALVLRLFNRLVHAVWNAIGMRRRREIRRGFVKEKKIRF